MSDTVYVLRDKERPEWRALHSYYRTLEEAQKAQSERKKFTRERPEPDGIPGTEYLEIVVEQIDWIACKTCGGHVTAKDPISFPYCRNCFYVGNAHEHIREKQLYDFRAAVPECDIGIEHTGGGCFWLAFHHPEKREYLIATDGDACIPEDDDGNPIRDGWGCVMLQRGCTLACRNETFEESQARRASGGESPCDSQCDDYMELLWRRDENGSESDQWCVRDVTDAEIIEVARKWVAGEIEFVAA